MKMTRKWFNGGFQIVCLIFDPHPNNPAWGDKGGCETGRDKERAQKASCPPAGSTFV